MPPPRYADHSEYPHVRGRRHAAHAFATATAAPSFVNNFSPHFHREVRNYSSSPSPSPASSDEVPDRDRDLAAPYKWRRGERYVYPPEGDHLRLPVWVCESVRELRLEDEWEYVAVIPRYAGLEDVYEVLGKGRRGRVSILYFGRERGRGETEGEMLVDMRQLRGADGLLVERG